MKIKYVILLTLFLASCLTKLHAEDKFKNTIFEKTVTREITIKILLVEFKDVKHRNPNYPSNLQLPAYTYDDFCNLFFSTGKYFSPNMYSPDGEKVFGSVSDYYRIMSDNNLIFSGYVLNNDLDGDNVPDWITLSKTKSYYNNDNGIGFLEESKKEAKKIGLDISTDENTFLSIIYSGHTYRKRMNTLNPMALYGMHEYIMGERFASSAPYQEERNDPAKNKVATYAHIGIHVHEIGHLLGLDDLGGGFENYYWCLMSKGAFNGPNQAGACPAPLNPYFRWRLGWISFDRIYDSLTKKLSYNLIKPEVYQLHDNKSDSFFLVEYRNFNCKMKLGTTEICDYNSFIKGNSSSHGVLVWRKMNGHFVKLLHSSGEKFENGDSHLYPGKSNTRILSPWSDSRPPKMGDYWVPNSKPSLNCGFEIINNGYDNVILDLYQDFPESASPSRPKKVDIVPSTNIKFGWTENFEPDFDYYKIYKMNVSGEYEYYDISDSNSYVDEFEKTVAETETKTYVYYRITAIDNQKKESALSKELKVAVLDDQTTAVKNKEEIIQRFSLSQNYPNPFNPSTTISYTIPQSVIPNLVRDLSTQIQEQARNDNPLITLKVYDLLGSEIATLVNEKQNPGSYDVNFNATNLSNGVYFYQLTAASTSLSADKAGSATSNFVETRKMILMK